MNTEHEWLSQICVNHTTDADDYRLKSLVPTALVFADWLDERGDERASAVRELAAKHNMYWTQGIGDLFVPKELADYNWREAFGYAGDRLAQDAKTDQPERALPNDTDTSVEKFGRIDVKRIVAMSEGENDGDNWLCVGELHDGRFFVLDAGCDYTGWD